MFFGVMDPVLRLIAFNMSLLLNVQALNPREALLGQIGATFEFSLSLNGVQPEEIT
jgi:hypothetical protein